MEIKEKKTFVKNTTVACPIIYGSLAYWLGKKAEDTATHRWTLFIRGPNDEDLSSFVSQVAFTLHPSFAEPIRVITKPPFEVCETGWGEFEAGIRIFFHDTDEQPIDLLHMIKLYFTNPQQQLSLKKPVVSEAYDEIVFTNPNADFYKNLLQYRPTPAVRSAERGGFDEENDVQQLTFVLDRLQREIGATKRKLLQLLADSTPSGPDPPTSLTSRGTRPD